MDAFLFICKEVGLNRDDMEDMTIGFCLDYIDTFIEQRNPNKKKKPKKASQKDFDAF